MGLTVAYLFYALWVCCYYIFILNLKRIMHSASLPVFVKENIYVLVSGGIEKNNSIWCVSNLKLLVIFKVWFSFPYAKYSFNL